MLPVKMDLTEKIAATLRQLRLDYPVNGEVLTAEKLSKAIGNNRAWMSQIESRRLKKIKREDIIKIYKLLHNEPDEKKAELIAEADLCSPFETRFDSDKKNSSYVNDSYSEGIISLDNLMSELRDTLLQKYKELNDSDRNTMLGCIESMIDNFYNDYYFTHLIYTVPIPSIEENFWGTEYIEEYHKALDIVYKQYIINLHTAFEKTDLKSFCSNYKEICSSIINRLTNLSPDEMFDNLDIVIEIDYYSKRIFAYIKNSKEYKLPNIELITLFDMINSMIQTLYDKLKLQSPLPITISNLSSNETYFDSIQLEISNRIMKAIKIITLLK